MVKTYCKLSWSSQEIIKKQLQKNVAFISFWTYISIDTEIFKIFQMNLSCKKFHYQLFHTDFCICVDVFWIIIFNERKLIILLKAIRLSAYHFFALCFLKIILRFPNSPYRLRTLTVKILLHKETICTCCTRGRGSNTFLTVVKPAGCWPEWIAACQMK